MIFSPSSLLNRGCVSHTGVRAALARNGVYKFGHEQEDIGLLTNLNPKGFYHLNQNQHWNAFHVDSRLRPMLHKRKHNELSNAFISCSVPYVIMTSFNDTAHANTTEVLFRRKPEVVFDHVSAPMPTKPFVLYSDDGDPVWAALDTLANKYEFVCSLSRKTEKEHIGTMSCTLPRNIFKGSDLGKRILNCVDHPLPGLSAVICENLDKTTTLELRLSS